MFTVSFYLEGFFSVNINIGSVPIIDPKSDFDGGELKLTEGERINLPAHCRDSV